MAKRRQKPKRETVGVCRVCACTYEEGCPQGCEWVDRDHTLCSVCAELTETEVELRRAEAIDELDQEIDFANVHLAQLKFRREVVTDGDSIHAPRP